MPDFQIFEPEPYAGHEILDRGRDHHPARRGPLEYPPGNLHSDTADVITDQFTPTCVQTSAQGDPYPTPGLHDGGGTVNG